MHGLCGAAPAGLAAAATGPAVTGRLGGSGGGGEATPRPLAAVRARPLLVSEPPRRGEPPARSERLAGSGEAWLPTAATGGATAVVTTQRGPTDRREAVDCDFCMRWPSAAPSATTASGDTGQTVAPADGTLAGWAMRLQPRIAVCK